MSGWHHVRGMTLPSLPSGQPQSRGEGSRVAGDGVGESHPPRLQLQGMGEIIDWGVENYRVKGVIHNWSAQTLHVETNLVGATSPRARLVQPPPAVFTDQRNIGDSIRYAGNFTGLQNPPLLNNPGPHLPAAFCRGNPLPSWIVHHGCHQPILFDDLTTLEYLLVRATPLSLPGQQ